MNIYTFEYIYTYICCTSARVIRCATLGVAPAPPPPEVSVIYICMQIHMNIYIHLNIQICIFCTSARVIRCATLGVAPAPPPHAALQHPQRRPTCRGNIQQEVKQNSVKRVIRGLT